MVVASFPIGKLVDRTGPWIPMILGTITLASGAALFIGGNFFTVMLSMCLTGLTHLLIMSSIMTLSASLVGPQNRGKVRGFVNFTGYIFTALGMLLGNMFYDFYAPLPFYLAMTLSIPVALVVLFRVRQPKKGEARY